jgi:hypothetical protein
MLNKDDVEKKDFSLALPGITHKLRAVSDGMMFEISESGQPPEKVLDGWYLILR